MTRNSSCNSNSHGERKRLIESCDFGHIVVVSSVSWCAHTQINPNQRTTVQFWMLAPADPHTLSRTTVQFTTPAPSYPTHKITKRRRTTVQITTLAPGYPHTQLPETTTDDGWCAHTPRDSTTNHKTLKREQGHLLNQTPYCWSMFSKESFLVLIRRHLPGV